MKRKRRDPGPDLYSLRCESCGRYLVRSESGQYLQCPEGHGKLQLDTERESEPADCEPSGAWFE